MGSLKLGKQAAIPAALRAVLMRERGWFGFRIALWGSYFTAPLFAEMEKRFGILRDEFAILASLYDYGSLSAKTICAITGRPKNSISRGVTRLTASKRIRSTTNRLDRREAILTLLASGRRLYERILPMCRERERLMLEPLSDAELAQLDELLAKLLNYYHESPEAGDLQ